MAEPKSPGKMDWRCVVFGHRWHFLRWLAPFGRSWLPGGSLTRNTALLRAEVAAHVAADQVVQETYWSDEDQRGCFIGCLTHSNNPQAAEQRYGLPVMIQRIAESIFERLPADEAIAFFAAFPDAVQCDGKDLSRVGWQFLAAELRSLPPQSAETQTVIDPVIAGIDLLARGMTWDQAAAEAAWDAAWDATDAAARAAWATGAAAWAAEAAARAARAAGEAEWAAAAAARAAGDVAEAAAWAAAARRQRDLLLRLVSEVEVRHAMNWRCFLFGHRWPFLLPAGYVPPYGWPKGARCIRCKAPHPSILPEENNG